MKRMQSALSLLLVFAMFFGLALTPVGPLATAAAETQRDYIVLDDCERDAAWQAGFNLKRDNADKKQGSSSLSCSGTGEPGFRRSEKIGIPLPEDWEEWYLEMWLYIDDLDNITNLGGSCIEFSQVQDQIELQWPLSGLDLENGWNRIQLKLSGPEASPSGVDQFETIENLRVWAITTKTVSMKIDDVVLVHSLEADDTAELERQLAAAKALTDEDLAQYSAGVVAALKTAIANAEEAGDLSQRSVDVAAAALKDALIALNFDGLKLDGSTEFAYVDFNTKQYAKMSNLHTDGKAGDHFGRGAIEMAEALYLTLDKSYIDAEDSLLQITFSYYDNQKDATLRLAYNTKDKADATSDKLLMTMKGDKTWKTASLVVEDAALREALTVDGDGYDLRFLLDGADKGYISQVKVSIYDPEDPMNKVPTFAPQTEQNNIIGKSVTGYQMWFGRDWYHNWANAAAGKGVFWEIWPYTKDYPTSSLWQSQFLPLNSGDPSMLFDSYDPGIIDTHFAWMEEYGIDGAGIQRFYGYTSAKQDLKKFSYLKTAIEKAEAHGRSVYMMYDMSGAGGADSTIIDRMQKDFVYNIEAQGIVSSPAYAHAEGKPVVCIWGLSADDNYPSAFVAYELVTWFQNRGYFVIVGTPDNNFSEDDTAYADVYKTADMISPWMVGRFGPGNVKEALPGMLEKDIAFCEANDVLYQPCMLPGFSWVNLKEESFKYNEIAREAGQFLWEQAKIIASYGCTNIYYSMFDEYDEGSNFMKGAQDFFDIPEGLQYFQTFAVDGKWLSADFYLRASKDATNLVRDVASGKLKLADVPKAVPTLTSTGPIYYRNSFEMAWVVSDKEGNAKTVPIDAIPRDVLATVDRDGFDFTMLGEAKATDGDEMYQTGTFSFHYAGESYIDPEGKVSPSIYSILNEQNFVVPKDLTLEYSVYAEDELGTSVFIDLLFDDGKLLSELQAGVGGQVGKVGEWVKKTVNVNNAFAGKTVTGIVIGYSRNAEGNFSAYVDDVIVQLGKEGCGNFDLVEPGLLGDINGDGVVNTTDARLALQYAVEKITLTGSQLGLGDVDGDGIVNTTDARLILQYAVEKIDKFPAGK